MRKLVFGALLMTLAAATPARAQGDHLSHFNLGGGFTIPVSDVADRFGTGGSFSMGLTLEPPQSAFGFQVEYGYNKLGGEDKIISISATPTTIVNGQAVISSHHSMHYIDFNGIMKTPGSSIVRPYAIGGFGMYYRSVSLTTPDVGYATYCDPYWYVCYPTAVSIDRIIGDRSSWDPGINLGGGLTLGLGDSAVFYVETRWHYMWGPEFTDVDGNNQKANGQYFPVTFGFRF